MAGGEGIARILGTGVARTRRGEMPKAPVPAALAALDQAGLGPRDVNAVTTHNPFAVNDLWFSQQTGIALERMNAYGCSLIYGRPQGPTGARLIVELLHTLRLRGGGSACSPAAPATPAPPWSSASKLTAFLRPQHGAKPRPASRRARSQTWLRGW